MYSAADELEFCIMTNTSLLDAKNAGKCVDCSRYETAEKLLIEFDKMNVVKAFSILDAVKQEEGEWITDFSMVFSKKEQNLKESYSMDWKNGVAATFFEYSQILFWTDISQSHRNAIWEDNGKIVAFCFYENSIGEAYFNLKPGYEELIPDMIKHAEQRLSKEDGSLEFQIFKSQKDIIKVAKDMGYEIIDEYSSGIYDFSKGALDYPLPEGFTFEEPGKFDMKKMIDASWRGFNHITEPEGGIERGYHLISAPHAMPELDVIIKNNQGEYVCYAGMWLVPENHLAYMEPLCTVPEYRRMGLASAALSECYRRTVSKGATHMTGGGDIFYYSIGYEPIIRRSIWKK